jgi:hypothetical protein
MHFGPLRMPKIAYAWVLLIHMYGIDRINKGSIAGLDARCNGWFV